MAGPNRPARLNRTLLATIGLVLLATGAAGIAFGTGALRSAVPGLDPTVPLLPEQIAAPAWLPWAVAAGGLVLGLLSLRWLLAQAQRRPKTGVWTLSGAGATPGTIRLDSDHAARALATDIEAYDHVTSVSAALVGDHRRPTVHLDVTADTGVDLTALRTRITSHALPRLRQALDSDGVRPDLILRLGAAAPQRQRLS